MFQKGLPYNDFIPKCNFSFEAFFQKLKNQLLKDNNFSLLRNLLFFYSGAGKKVIYNVNLPIS